MQIFDGFYKTSWSRPDTRLNDRLFARILKYVRHAIVWSLKFDMIDRIGRVNSCRESNSVLVWHVKINAKDFSILHNPCQKWHSTRQCHALRREQGPLLSAFFKIWTDSFAFLFLLLKLVPQVAIYSRNSMRYTVYSSN